MATVPSSTTAASAASSSSQYAYPSAGTTSYFPTPFHIQQTPPPPPVPYIGAAPPPTFPVVRLPVYPAPATVYSLPQYHQAQQLFQRDAQTITPEALESVKAALASSDIEHKADTKKKAIPWKAAGQTWEDPTLADWPEMILEMRTSLRRKQSYQRRVCCTNENEAVREHFDKCKEKQKLTVAPNGRRRPHYLPPRTSFV